MTPHRLGARQLANATAVTTTAAVFGPYTPIEGVRTEQIAVYVTLLVLGALHLSRIRLERHALAGAGAMTISLGTAAIGGIWPPFNETGFVQQNAWAGVDNLALPLACLLLVQIWLILGRQHELLRCILVTTVVAMSANALVALLATAQDLRPILSAFWTAAPGVTVAENAASMGRITGILNQPAEAGLLYGLALIGAVYVLHDRPILLGLSASALCVGGLLCASKIFLLVAFPLAVWAGMRTLMKRAARFAAVGFLCVAGGFLGYRGLLSEWQGMAFVGRLLNPVGDVISFYTAGRIGPDGTLNPVVDSVMQTSPWVGMGVSGLAVAYDNAWVEHFVMAGVIGVLAQTAILGTMVHAAWAINRLREPALSAFSRAVTVLAVVSSVGLPVFTANRSGTVLCLVMGVAVLARPHLPHPAEDPAGLGRSIALAPIGVAERIRPPC